MATLTLSEQLKQQQANLERMDARAALKAVFPQARITQELSAAFATYLQPIERAESYDAGNMLGVKTGAVTGTLFGGARKSEYAGNMRNTDQFTQNVESFEISADIAADLNALAAALGDERAGLYRQNNQMSIFFRTDRDGSAIAMPMTADLVMYLMAATRSKAGQGLLKTWGGAAHGANSESSGAQSFSAGYWKIWKAGGDIKKQQGWDKVAGMVLLAGIYWGWLPYFKQVAGGQYSEELSSLIAQAKDARATFGQQAALFTNIALQMQSAVKRQLTSLAKNPLVKFGLASPLRVQYLDLKDPVAVAKGKVSALFKQTSQGAYTLEGVSNERDLDAMHRRNMAAIAFDDFGLPVVDDSARAPWKVQKAFTKDHGRGLTYWPTRNADGFTSTGKASSLENQKTYDLYFGAGRGDAPGFGCNATQTTGGYGATNRYYQRERRYKDGTSSTTCVGSPHVRANDEFYGKGTAKGGALGIDAYLQMGDKNRQGQGPNAPSASAEAEGQAFYEETRRYAQTHPGYAAVNAATGEAGYRGVGEWALSPEQEAQVRATETFWPAGLGKGRSGVSLLPRGTRADFEKKEIKMTPVGPSRRPASAAAGGGSQEFGGAQRQQRRSQPLAPQWEQTASLR